MRTLALALLLAAGSAHALDIRAPSPNGTAITPNSVTVTGASGLNTTYGVVAGSITVGGAVLTANVVSGNVGVGTNNPQNLLHLSAAAPALRLQDTQGGGTTILSGVLAAAGEYDLYDLTNTKYFMRYAPTNGLGLMPTGGNVGIGTTNPATTLDVNGSAQFGSGATKSTFTATGFYVPVSMTLAQIQAYTPSALENHGLITCSNCASAYSVCQATGTVINAFRLGTSGTAACQ